MEHNLEDFREEKNIILTIKDAGEGVRRLLSVSWDFLSFGLPCHCFPTHTHTLIHTPPTCTHIPTHPHSLHSTHTCTQAYYSSHLRYMSFSLSLILFSSLFSLDVLASHRHTHVPSLTSSHPPFLPPSHLHISLTSSHLPPLHHHTLPHILTPSLSPSLTSSHFPLSHLHISLTSSHPPSHPHILSFSCLTSIFTLSPHIIIPSLSPSLTSSHFP